MISQRRQGSLSPRAAGRKLASPWRVLLPLLMLCCVALGPVACHRQTTGQPSVGSPPPRETAAPAARDGVPSAPPLQPDFAVDAVSSREGEASWYSVPEHSLPERRAWTGEMTAASDVLPLNTYARIHLLEGGGETKKSVIVRITDHGIHQKGTLVDLSKEAAEALGMLKAGKVRVRLEVLALKNATADKPVENKNAPTGPKLDQPAATKKDEELAAKAKTAP